jgi:hypothetical protein
MCSFNWLISSSPETVTQNNILVFSIIQRSRLSDDLGPSEIFLFQNGRIMIVALQWDSSELRSLPVTRSSSARVTVTFTSAVP